MDVGSGAVALAGALDSPAPVLARSLRGRHWGAPEVTRTAWPYALAGGLLAWAVPPLWRARRSPLPLYAALVMVLGTGFEWLSTSRGGFSYPVCPSRACLGATVPLVWLPLLYV